MTVGPDAAQAYDRATNSRWFGIGTSSAVAPRQAAEEAASQALQGLDPKLVIVFCSSELDVDRVAAEIRALVPDAPMIGCTTAGEISTDSVLEGTAASCSGALANLGGREPLGLLMFDCIARRSVLGPGGVEDEMAVVREVVPSVPTLGFYTYGEIARTHGARGFHNQTLVTLALS